MPKRVLIAGGGELLEALSRAFLEEGATVALLTPDAACLKQVLDSLGGEHDDRFGLVMGEKSLDMLLGRLGRLDVLVCAPPILPHHMPLDRYLAEQVAGPSNLLQIAQAWMYSRGGGRLVAVAPDGDTQATSMVREALAALVRRLAEASGPGIRINLLCPQGATSASVADCARFLAGGAGRALNGQVLRLSFTS
ncbi:Rossmann-fold NAD(P)-binding domain-containing protein [Modicisalibacter luteus]|uniref:SDR family oxidoreductase n=1 Tax=Modicisalibacter luteus TaxID=453962 RepID=A0ABV7M5N3_9GAMM|nr:hypothetical protein [Halomonas lutea]GHA87842.1 hypothetical protein GCM10007159_06560 [Halomonas lutea]